MVQALQTVTAEAPHLTEQYPLVVVVDLVPMALFLLVMVGLVGVLLDIYLVL
jgi:hypothetical protein